MCRPSSHRTCYRGLRRFPRGKTRRCGEVGTVELESVAALAFKRKGPDRLTSGLFFNPAASYFPTASRQHQKRLRVVLNIRRS
jgi:hypothetical protein